MAIKVEMSCGATEMIQRIGVCPECVLQAVQSPDDVHKIMPGNGDHRDWPIISLYVKRFSNGIEESLLLVQALKQGGVVLASAVWQIYPNDVGVSESAGALDVFKAFLAKYGVHLKIAHGSTKLVTYHVVGSSTSNRQGKWERVFTLPEGVLSTEDRRVTQNPEILSSKWTRQLNVKLHVALLYTINLSNYFHDLAARRTVAERL